MDGHGRRRHDNCAVKQFQRPINGIGVDGHMMPRGRLDQLCRAVEEGRIAGLDALNAAWDQILAAYADDE